MPEFKIHNLWPTPIYENNFSVKSEWVDYVKKIEYERTSTQNGYISKDRYLLENSILSDLKNNIDIHINNYTNKFLNIRDNANFYMQNSWSTRHDKNDWCQAHYHTGSLISGVYYIDVPDNSGELVFQRMSNYVNLFHSTINIEYKEPNYINDDLQMFKVKSGDIILFPSHVMHRIRENLTDYSRYSLAFNYFVRGKFGIEEFQLEIK